VKLYHRKPLINAISLAVAGTALSATVVLPAHAANPMLEEVVVTAQKRTQNLQDVPVSVQVLGNEQLENLQVKGFDDYIVFLPTVSYTSNGPGYGQVYMRGIASGGDGNHSGSMPSVGVYLDEQPVTTINQILDVHIYDISRIETLSGPQGSLYGQGSQAGTIRIITNKPVIGESQAGYDLYANTTHSGDPGYGLEGFINIPINDRMAARLVAWHEKTGGYIDNVPGELHYAIDGIVKSNADIAEKNFNTSENSGLRALLKIDLNDDWTVTPGIMYQKGKTHGVWQHNPDYVGDLQVKRYFPDWTDEDWYQASLTVEGKLGGLDIVYAGAHLDRNLTSQYDYSGYAEYLEWAYSGYGYECWYYDPLGGCADPSQYVSGDENFKRTSHELRIQSAQDQRFRWIAGLFYQKQEHYFDLQWVVPDLDPAQSTVQNATTIWQTNQDRIDRDKAAFGEAYFDVTKNLTAIGGVRFFKYDNSLYGFNGFLKHCTGYYDDNGHFVQDANGTPQFPCYNTGILNDRKKGNDHSLKGSLEYRIDDQKMVYVTYSEGFRAGGVNRARVPNIPTYDPDWVYNYEVGWKTSWAGGRVRFNGSIYQENWNHFQFGFLDFSVSNLTIIQNVGNARTRGVEWDLNVAATDNLTLTFSGSYNDAKLKKDFWRLEQDRLDGLPPNAPAGTRMPYVPRIQLTGIARFNFNMGDFPAFGQIAATYRGKAWNDLQLDNRTEMDGYAVVNLSAGIDKGNWSASLYVNNVADERGQIDILKPGYYSPSGVDYNQNIIRPRSVGIRWAQRF